MYRLGICGGISFLYSMPNHVNSKILTSYLFWSFFTRSRNSNYLISLSGSGAYTKSRSFLRIRVDEDLMPQLYLSYL